MNTTEIKRALEAALLCTPEPLAMPQLRKLFDDEYSADLLRPLLDEIALDWAEQPVELVSVASGWRFQSRPEYAVFINRLTPEKAPKYSRAVMETLAIIAYRQPVTRGDIEEIRGVSVSSQIVKTLEERGWIDVIGHKEVPGRPALFGTTKQFLDDLGLRSVQELPPIDEMGDGEAADFFGKQIEGEPDAEVADSADPGDPAATAEGETDPSAAEEGAVQEEEVAELAGDAVSDEAVAGNEAVSEAGAQFEAQTGEHGEPDADPADDPDAGVDAAADDSGPGAALAAVAAVAVTGEADAQIDGSTDESIDVSTDVSTDATTGSDEDVGAEQSEAGSAAQFGPADVAGAADTGTVDPADESGTVLAADDWAANEPQASESAANEPAAVDAFANEPAADELTTEALTADEPVGDGMVAEQAVDAAPAQMDDEAADHVAAPPDDAPAEITEPVDSVAGEPAAAASAAIAPLAVEGPLTGSDENADLAAPEAAAEAVETTEASEPVGVSDQAEPAADAAPQADDDDEPSAEDRVAAESVSSGDAELDELAALSEAVALVDVRAAGAAAPPPVDVFGHDDEVAAGADNADFEDPELAPQVGFDAIQDALSEAAFLASDETDGDPTAATADTEHVSTSALEDDDAMAGSDSATDSESETDSERESLANTMESK